MSIMTKNVQFAQIVDRSWKSCSIPLHSHLPSALAAMIHQVDLLMPSAKSVWVTWIKMVAWTHPLDLGIGTTLQGI